MGLTAHRRRLVGIADLKLSEVALLPHTVRIHSSASDSCFSRAVLQNLQSIVLRVGNETRTVRYRPPIDVLAMLLSNPEFRRSTCGSALALSSFFGACRRRFADLLMNYDNSGRMDRVNCTDRFKFLQGKMRALICAGFLLLLFDLNADEFQFQRSRHRSLTSILYRVSNNLIQVRRPFSAFRASGVAESGVLQRWYLLALVESLDFATELIRALIVDHSRALQRGLQLQLQGEPPGVISLCGAMFMFTGTPLAAVDFASERSSGRRRRCVRQRR